MNKTVSTNGGLMALFNVSESPRQAEKTNNILLEEIRNDGPFVSLAYSNLVVFTALLFSLAGLHPGAAVGYVLAAFILLILTALSSRLARNHVSRQSIFPIAIAGYVINELALVSVLIFDYLAPVRADGFVAIVTVASISFLSAPLFARFLRSFLLIKLGVIIICCAYAVTTPLGDVGYSIALGALMIAFLLMAAIGYWIISRRREEVNLRSELTRLNIETEKARDQARADYDLRQRMLSYIGHDLRQPISAANFILHEMSSHMDNPDKQGLLADVKDCVGSAGRMIEDIVQLTHYNSPNIEILRENIDLVTMFDQILREYEASAKAAGSMLYYVPTSVRLSFDPVFLQRILRNLTRNAIKHARAAKILLGVRRRPDGIEIWVIDNGCSLIVERPVQPPTAGLGLGLEISRQLARACGAKLELVSEAGKGTCCRLHIPNALLT